jgi:hypothetical protein
MLIYRRRGPQLYFFPFAPDDSLSNLLSRLSFAVLHIGIIKLLHADRAFRSMRVFKTTMQAFMTHAVAVAIARLLIKHGFDLGR